MAIPIAFSLNGLVEGWPDGGRWSLFKNCFQKLKQIWQVVRL
jgi:hypothetical protein